MILFISRLGFEGGVWILISPVPGHCLLVTSNTNVIVRYFRSIDIHPGKMKMQLLDAWAVFMKFRLQRYIDLNALAVEKSFGHTL